MLRFVKAACIGFATRGFGVTDFADRPAKTKLVCEANERSLERETGIEPATNSLEGCDSTTELLPPIESRTVGHSVN